MQQFIHSFIHTNIKLQKQETMPVHFEIRIDGSAVIESLDILRQQWKDYLLSRSTATRIDATTFLQAPQHLYYGGDSTIHTEGNTVSQIMVAGTSFQVHVFLLSNEEPAMEELEPSEGGGGGDQEWTAACENWTLPHSSLHSSWEALIMKGSTKQQLLNFATSALLFADQHVSGHLVHWNRLLLLHGPPGTGKTSLCRALAQKLAIRMNRRFSKTCLLEIHSHSLFSKWFSTSGKLIQKLFDLIQEMLQEDPSRLVCVLMDEIESLASNRSAAASSSAEPTDAMRAVNSLLTGLDRLRHFPNVLVLATTNLTQSVDTAFLDRADWKVYIGPPCLEARCAMLQSSLDELQRVGIIAVVDDAENDTVTTLSKQRLLSLALLADGLSGRSLRRLPLQAHALLASSMVEEDSPIAMSVFLNGMEQAIRMELESLKLAQNRP